MEDYEFEAIAEHNKLVLEKKKRIEDEIRKLQSEYARLKK